MHAINVHLTFYYVLFSFFPFRVSMLISHQKSEWWSFCQCPLIFLGSLFENTKQNDIINGVNWYQFVVCYVFFVCVILVNVVDITICRQYERNSSLNKLVHAYLHNHSGGHNIMSFLYVYPIIYMTEWNVVVTWKIKRTFQSCIHGGAGSSCRFVQITFIS